MAQQRRVLRVASPGRGGGADGEAFPTVQAAVDAVPLGNRVRVVIRLAPGVYREPVYVAKTKNFITLAADAPETTVISWDNTATRIKHSQGSGQAVAVRVTADRCAFYNCRFLGWQVLGSRFQAIKPDQDKPWLLQMMAIRIPASA
ncbi:hypothetical protein PR202_gb07955 [Eleusine coracana subsp. coracana]|uniref:pectinesterase n=1 Tax=Eleusine coracana subsp. coracana TaxID=191504 RepID=A0AAV5EAZ2_ELECO|nr:hypothetical protein PR202_gb07955 [Eleusine coracana subsp. coracana]